MITGYIENKTWICIENENQIANEIKIFFARFVTTDFFQERALELETRNSENGNFNNNTIGRRSKKGTGNN